MAFNLPSSLPPPPSPPPHGESPTSKVRAPTPKEAETPVEMPEPTQATTPAEAALAHPTEKPLDAESIREDPLKTAAKRASYTRWYLKESGRDLPTLAEEVGRPPLSMPLDISSDESLVSGIFELQHQHLGFPLTVNGTGCDGMFGPYTNKKLHELQAGRETRGRAADLLSEVTTNGRDTSATRGVKISREGKGPAEASPRRPSIVPDSSRPPERLSQTELPPVAPSYALYIGDSLTVGQLRHLPGVQKVVKGGRQTRWMKDNLLKQPHRTAGRTVVFGGINDIVSGIVTAMIKSQKSPEAGRSYLKEKMAATRKNLSDIYAYARENNISVVACTMYDWDEETLGKHLAKKFDMYNDPAKRAEFEVLGRQVTGEFNEWIRSQKRSGAVDEVVDLEREIPIGSPGFQLNKKDGLHLRDYSGIARIVRERSGILAH